jgi:hypothetical protein
MTTTTALPKRPVQPVQSTKSARTFAPLQAKTPTPRIVLHAVEGWGKTTFAAFAPSPLILMGRGETGVQRLVDSGRIPENVPVAAVESWEDTLGWLDDLAANTQGIKTLALDSMGVFERLCHEHVCKRDFNGDWGERGFGSFNKGYDVSVAEWNKLLQRLDLINKLGIVVVILGHSRVKAFKNPIGPDFDRFVCDAHEKTWAVTARWADAVYFGNFVSAVVGAKSLDRKGKGIGGADRMIYTNRRDAWDAKPGYAVPEQISIPNDHTQVWNTVWTAIVTKENA